MYVRSLIFPISLAYSSSQLSEWAQWWILTEPDAAARAIRFGNLIDVALVSPPLFSHHGFEF